MTSHRLGAPFVVAFLVVLSGDDAFAQTISPGGQPYPDRVVNGVSVGSSTRPQNFTPLGISNEDCVQNTSLRFTVTLTGFTGNDSVEVWGSLASDCTAPTDRGIGATSAVCWGLRAGNVTDPIISNPQTYTFDVRVQDLVGWQHTPPTAAEAANPPAQGMSACSAQTTLGAVPMKINFLAVDASGNSDGTPYQYAIPTDIMNPPAPAGVEVSTSGPDLFVDWTPNTDVDTIGYDVFFASLPAADGQAGCTGATLTRSGSGDPTVSGATVASYDLGQAQSNTTAAVVVSAVDAFGNVSEGETPTCAPVGAVDPGGAGGVSCAVGAPGDPGAALPCLGLLAAAWMGARLARRRRSVS
jgi:hypothetical protein